MDLDRDGVWTEDEAAVRAAWEANCDDLTDRAAQYLMPWAGERF